jgi:hypothetical protein
MRTFLTPVSFEAAVERDFAELPARRAVISPEPSFVAAVRAERDAGRRVLFLYSRIARVDREDFRWEN